MSLLLDQKWNAMKADDIKTEGLATTSTPTYILQAPPGFATVNSYERRDYPN